MADELYPNAVKAQTDTTKSMANSIKQYAEETLKRSKAFQESNSQLKGQAYDAARQRISEYDFLLSSMSYNGTLMKNAANRLSECISNHLGSAEHVSEQEWINKRNDANDRMGRISSDWYKWKRDFPELESLIDYVYGGQMDKAKKQKSYAEETLARIANYKSDTSYLFNDVTDMSNSINKGIVAFQSSAYDSERKCWPPLDKSYINEIKSIASKAVGITSASDIYSNGVLDEDALKRLLEKPIELWTDEEVLAFGDAISDLQTDMINAKDYKSRNNFIKCFEKLINTFYSGGTYYGKAKNTRTNKEVFVYKYKLKVDLGTFTTKYSQLSNNPNKARVNAWLKGIEYNASRIYVEKNGNGNIEVSIEYNPSSKTFETDFKNAYSGRYYTDSPNLLGGYSMMYKGKNVIGNADMKNTFWVMDQNNLRFMSGETCYSKEDIDNAYDVFKESNILMDRYRGKENPLGNFVDNELINPIIDDPLGYAEKKVESSVRDTVIPEAKVFDDAVTVAKYGSVCGFYSSKEEAQKVINERLEDEKRSADDKYIGKIPIFNVDGTVSWVDSE